MVMFARSTKVLIAALVLAGTSLAVVADASPRSAPGGWQSGVDTTPKERHDPTNTNGG
jgi:hypothetical protein